jgi:centromere/kinetochore protein ZW10
MRIQNTIRLGDEAVDPNIKSLFLTIEDVIQFLVEKLPSEFIKPLSDAMMPDLSARLKEAWLDTAVPASLDDMAEYQKSLAQVHEFAEKLGSLSWPGGDIFEDWIADAPKMWISKKRETSLDWTRNQLSLGEYLHLCLTVNFIQFLFNVPSISHSEHFMILGYPFSP